MDESCSCNKECSCCKTKHRDEVEYKNLMNRLNRIEGQIRGIKGMVEKESYCVDILTQVTAIQAALNSFNKVLLSNHIKSCIVDNNSSITSSLPSRILSTTQLLI